MALLLDFKRNSTYDLDYWVDYAFDIGFLHLMPHQEYYAMGVFKLFDLDVHLTMLTLIVVSTLVFLAIGKKIFNFICCRKGAVEPGPEKEKKD
mmetsp:Transcript_24816/g.24321  ORF Transcript_24816/g.24321 Transcript_24816/m.24321 type:complete len:93 (-) Transcript_24816:36-314(-)